MGCLINGDIETAQQRWREASLTDQPDDLIFAAFVRSLTPEQQSVLAGVMDLVEKDEAFRWF